MRNRQKSYYERERETVVLKDVKQTNRTRKINKHTKKHGYRSETKTESTMYSEIQKDGLDFVRLYFLNYTWYVNDLHNI
jgi:chorismate mutase